MKRLIDCLVYGAGPDVLQPLGIKSLRPPIVRRYKDRTDHLIFDPFVGGGCMAEFIKVASHDPTVGKVLRRSSHRHGVSAERTTGRETVVRGGFGVFYDTGNDFSAFQFAVFPFTQTTLPTNVTFPLNPRQVGPPAIPASQSTITPPYGTV